jgi:hypothetical protein
LTAWVWLLANLILSVAWAYGVPRMMIAFLIVERPQRWIALGLWSVVPVLLIVHGLRSLFLRRHFTGIGWIAVVALGFLFVWPDALLGLRLRFYATKFAYDRVIEDVEAGNCSGKSWSAPVDMVECRKPVLVTFAWGGLGSGWFGVAYDATDEIANPVQERSASWKARDVGSLLCCSYVAARLGGHYYLANGYLGDDCG